MSEPKAEEFSFGLSSSPESPKLEELGSNHSKHVKIEDNGAKDSSNSSSLLKLKDAQLSSSSSEPKLTATEWQRLHEKQRQREREQRREHRREHRREKDRSKSDKSGKRDVVDPVKRLPLNKQYILWAAEHSSHPASLNDAKKAIMDYPGTYYDVFHDERIDRYKLIEERKRLGRYLKDKTGDYFKSGTQFRQFVEHLRPGLSKVIYKYENVAS